MQILFFSKPLAIFLCFVLWALLQLAASGICLWIPDRYFDCRRFPFRAYGWEKGGEVYQKWLRVHQWKKYLPDGGALRGEDYRKKTLAHLSEEHMTRFLTESCRAEATHFVAILPFWVFGFLAPPEVIVYMLIYALAVNVPCMLVQRYNRPRVLEVVHKRYAQGG